MTWAEVCSCLHARGSRAQPAPPRAESQHGHRRQRRSRPRTAGAKRNRKDGRRFFCKRAKPLKARPPTSGPKGPWAFFASPLAVLAVTTVVVPCLVFFQVGVSGFGYGPACVSLCSQRWQHDERIGEGEPSDHDACWEALARWHQQPCHGFRKECRKNAIKLVALVWVLLPSARRLRHTARNPS